MRTAIIPMWQEIIRKWNCRRFAPLLTAYAEGELDANRRGPVEAHLELCDDCQEQIALLAETGDLLRAHPPAVPELSTDLWARIQAEIDTAPAPAPTVTAPRPTKRPAPAGTAWRNFGTAFVGSGALVAAAVTGVLLTVQPLMRQEREAREADARKSAAENTMVAKTAGMSAGSGVAGISLEIRSGNISTAPAIRKPTTPEPAPDKVLVAAKARTERISRPHRRSLRLHRPVMVAAVTSPLPADNSATMMSESVSNKPMMDGPVKPIAAAATPEINGASLPPGSVSVATSEASVAPRDVPAPRSVADVAVRMRSQQVLFTYTGR